MRVVTRGEQQGPAMRVTFSKEGLATYRGGEETEFLLPRDESSCTLRLVMIEEKIVIDNFMFQSYGKRV